MYDSVRMLLFVRNLVFTLVVPGTVAVYLPLYFTGDLPVGPTGAVVTGSVLILIGAAVYLSCQWDFARFGRGTPAPIDAPSKFVSRGLYRHVRNPMYLGVLTVILGWATVFRATALLWYGLGVALMFHLFVLIYEEPHLRRVFGREYEEYCARINRWLPRLDRS
ncbi:MAG: isoprenylcysteine carboxylmethyltransferase family protein [Steroidobacteraceae bacterium]